MTVWIANPFDNLPDEGTRPQRYAAFAEAFAAAGHETVLWSCDFSHARKERRNLSDAIRRDWTLRLVHVPEYRRNVSFARFASHRAFGRAFLREAREAVASGALRKPDLVIASAPPLACASAAVALKREFGCKASIDIQDAWPETFARLLPLPSARLRNAFSHIVFAPFYREARAAYAAADFVTAVSERYLDIAMRAGAPAGRVALFRLGVPLGEAPRRAAGDGPLKAVYIGNLGRTYDISTLIEAVERFPGATLDIAGDGPCRGRVERAVSRCGRVRYRGYLGGRELRALLEKCDLGIVPMRPDAFVGVPGKLADYAAAALPVASSLGGEAAEMIAGYGAGFRYEYGNRRSLEEVFAKASGDRAMLAAAGLRAREMAEKEFDASRIAAEFVRFTVSAAL